MPGIHAQIWQGSRFSIERRAGVHSGTVIFRLTGPFTARDMYTALTPQQLRNVFEYDADSTGAPLELSVFDLSGVPYMDSAGLGMLVSHYVRCENKHVRMVAAGITPRVQQLLKVTRVEDLIPTASSVEEAEGAA